MSSSKFYFRPGQGEQIETVVRMHPDSQSTIHGYIKDPAGEPFADAAVLLFEAQENKDPRLVSQMITDELGQFAFGPLDPGTLYLIRIFKSTTRIREIEQPL